MNRRHICIIVGVALAVSGCAVQRSEIVSPYQKALGAYYKAIETQAPADLAAADEEASAILAKDPGDHSARILRANVSLTRLRRESASEEAQQVRRRLLTDLITVSAGVGTVGDAEDWVPARTLVVMGDLLVLEGDAVVQSALAGGSADRSKVAEAKSLFDAARHYYSGAVSLAEQKKPDPTPGLMREAGNARQGHLVALRGALNAVDVLDPDLSLPMAAAVRADLVRQWEAQATTGNVPAASAGALSFDAGQHAAMRSLYVTLGNQAQRQLSNWCKANKPLVQKAPAPPGGPGEKTLDEGTAIVRRALSMSELEALHAAVARLLRGAGDNSASNDKMLFLLGRDLKQSCDAFQ